jgi:hypothetical protein
VTTWEGRPPPLLFLRHWVFLLARHHKESAAAVKIAGADALSRGASPEQVAEIKNDTWYRTVATAEAREGNYEPLRERLLFGNPPFVDLNEDERKMLALLLPEPKLPKGGKPATHAWFDVALHVAGLEEEGFKNEAALACAQKQFRLERRVIQEACKRYRPEIEWITKSFSGLSALAEEE